MNKKVQRNYLEINFLKDLKETTDFSEKYSINLVDPDDFQLNKFFYKNIGKKYQWNDRLIWSDLNWINYINNKKLFTYILKDREKMAGYFELIINKEIKEVEIAYFGILEEYFGKKLGGYLLSEAIKVSFKIGCTRVIVHTCSLDHKNALNNYISRGMKIFKIEIIRI